MVFPVGKGIKVGADTDIIIPITEDFTHDHHRDSVKAAGIIMLISMAISHPLQAPHSMPHNPILLTNTKNAPNMGMIMRRLSNRVVVTKRMWVTCLLKTSKQVANFAESELLSEIKSENLIPINVGPAITGQLAEVAKRCLVTESCKVPMVGEIPGRLEMPSNCNFAKFAKLCEEIANSKKLLPYHNRADKRLADIQKSISLASSAILQQMSIAALQCQ